MPLRTITVRTLAFLILLSAGVSSFAFEFSSGGSVGFNQTYDTTKSFFGSLRSGGASFDPLIAAFGGIWEGRLSLHANVGEDLYLDIGESWFGLYPTEWMLLKAGRFEIRPGTALFLTNLSWFAPADPVSLLDLSGKRVLTDQVMIRFMIGNLYAGAAWVPPNRAIYTPPDPDNDFFPKIDVMPEENPFGTMYVLSGIKVEELSEPETASSGWGELAVEAGLSAGMFDVRVLYFNGMERDAALQPGILLNGLYPRLDFTLLLFPHRNRVQAFGAALSLVPEPWSWGAVSFWAEGSHTVGRTAVTVSDNWRGTEVSGQMIRGEVVQVNETAFTAGTLLDLSAVPVSVFTEMRTVERFDNQVETEPPLLRRLALGGVRGRLWNDRIELLCAAAWSPPDGGWAAAVNLSVTLFGDSALTIRYPFFFGPEKSELGQYHDVKLLTFAFEARF
jgi:hypothetical protein